MRLHAKAAKRSDIDVNPRTDPPLDFPNSEWGTLSPQDYARLGLMAGLEVHQQLLTPTKLFCRCPAGIRTTKIDAEVLRQMRPTLSELGEYDGTALMEFKTKKEIVYLIERESVCTYELDDTPPFEVSSKAVSIAVEVCQLLNLNLVSELHVMRKQYLDGSIPAGFQRTTMVGLDGEIPFPGSELPGKNTLRIRQLSLEEDSCREVSDVGHRIVFRTDRLGTPLIETVTEPELLTPRDVQAAIQLIARVAHATGKVRRGPGAARQDVNVSIAGGRRVEIKGVPSHRIVPRLVHNEAFRQLNLLRIKHALHQRGVGPDMLDPGPSDIVWHGPLAIDARAIVRGCPFPPIDDALLADHMVAAVRLPGFAGLLAHRTQPGQTFSDEIADRVRVIACPSAYPFMLHSDASHGEMSDSRRAQLAKAVGAESTDAVVLLWGPADDVDTAVRETLARAQEALEGVPAETRQPMPDGTTGFERILPGAGRMYPDTDTPPVAVADALVHEIGMHLPTPPWQRYARGLDLGLSPDQATRLADAPWYDLFVSLTPPSKRTAQRLFHGLTKRIPRYWRAGAIGLLPSAAQLAPLVEALEARPAFADLFEVLLDRVLRDRDMEPQAIANSIPETMSESQAVTICRDTVLAMQFRSREPQARIRAAMRPAMEELRGRFPAKLALQALATAIEELA